MPCRRTFRSEIGGSPLTASVLGYGWVAVSMCSSQCRIAPTPEGWSSITYSAHVPAGLVPSKTESRVLPLDGGAGASNGSVPTPPFVGW